MTVHNAQHPPGSLFCDSLISSHLKRIYLQIYRVVRNVDDAQDLTQEVFIKAWSNAAQLRAYDKAGHWLSRIASNLTIDFLRQGRSRPTVHLAHAGDPVDTTRANPERSAIIHDQCRKVLPHLSILTQRERTALLLRDVEDWRTPEIALHMKCSHATVRSHIANARVKLRHLRCPGGVIPSDVIRKEAGEVSRACAAHDDRC